MARTFGGNTGDDVNWLRTNSILVDDSSGIVAGWWYPTTLTAARQYWGISTATSTAGAQVGPAGSTSEIRLVTDCTTDGVWNTTGAGITTNKWWFIAFMWTISNTGPTHAWRVWVGDIQTAPLPVTLTQATAPVGNSAGNASFVLGSGGTSATNVWQGDIGAGMLLAFSGGYGQNHPFAMPSAGTIDANAEDLSYRRFVVPFWASNKFPELLCYPCMNPTVSTDEHLIYDLEGESFGTTVAFHCFRRAAGLTPEPFLLGTCNLPVKSALRAPRGYCGPPNLHARRRR